MNYSDNNNPLKPVTLLVFLLTIFNSSVNAQCIPFREGNQWGLVDTNLSTIIQPKYSSIYEIVDGIFEARVGNEISYISNKDKTIFTPDISFAEFTKLNSEHKYSTKYVFAIVTTNRNKSLLRILIKDNFSTDLVLGPNYENFDIKDKTVTAYYFEKDQFLETSYTINSDYTLSPIVEKQESTIKFESSTLDLPTNNREIKNIELDYIDKKEGIKLIIQQYYGSSVGRAKSVRRDTIHTVYSDLKILNYSGPYLRLRTNQEIQYYEKRRINLKNSAIVINKDGKYGLLNALGKITIPTEYDYIDPNIIPANCKFPMFRCQRQNKWGVINGDNEIIIPFEYDSLLLRSTYFEKSGRKTCYYLTSGLGVIKSGKKGVINWSNEVMIPFTTDSKITILPEASASYLILKKNNLYGICDGKNCIEPIFELQPSRIHRINNYLLARFEDDKHKLIGYANKYGTKYYKD